MYDFSIEAVFIVVVGFYLPIVVTYICLMVLFASPFLIYLSVPPWRWAWLGVPGTTDFLLYTHVLNSSLAHNTFVLGVVAKVFHLTQDKSIIIFIA